jgi:hypothetical protein
MNPSVSLWACGASPSNSFKELMRALVSAEISPTAGEALSPPLRGTSSCLTRVGGLRGAAQPKIGSSE